MSLNEEIHDIRKLLEKQSDNDMKPLLIGYKRSLDNVRTELAKIYMQYSVDGELKVSKSQRYIILKQIEKDLVEQAKELGAMDVEITTNLLTGLFEESYLRTAFTIDKGLDVVMDFTILRPEFVEAAIFMPIEGEMYSDRIWSNKDKLVKRLKSEIEKGMVQGDSIDKMAARIKKSFQVSTYESTRLVRTEMARCMTMAQEEIYKSSGVVEKVLFDATLDFKTSEICSSYDGKIFDMNTDYPKPPLHPNCRSAILPVIKNWSPTKKRENVRDDTGTKQIIDYSDYDSWKESRGI